MVGDRLRLFENVPEIEQMIAKIITEKLMVPVRLLARELNPEKENENVWLALTYLAAKIFLIELYLYQPPEVLIDEKQTSLEELKVLTEKNLKPKIIEVKRKMKLIIQEEAKLKA